MPRTDAQTDRAAAACGRGANELAPRRARPAEGERNPCRDQARLERGDRPSRRGQLPGSLAGGGEQRRRRSPGPPGGAKPRVAGKRGPTGPLLLLERAPCALRFLAGDVEVASEQCGFGQEEARLREIGGHASVSELLDGALRGGSGFVDQVNREQDLGPGSEVHPARYAVRDEVLVGLVKPLERGRNVTAACCDPAEVVSSLRGRKLLAHRAVEALRADEIPFGGAKRAAVRVEEPAVVQQPRLVTPVAGPAEERERAAIAVERVIVTTESLQDQRALRLQARRFLSREDVRGAVRLAQRAGRVAAVGQDERQAHARLRGPAVRRRALRDLDGAPEVRGRRGEILQLLRGET